MTQAEELFNQAYVRTMKLWSSITTFRDSLLGVSDAVLKRQQEQVGKMYDLLAYDPAYTKLLVNPKGFADKVNRAKFVAATADGFLKGTIDSLDAATVVFAHSVLDAAAFDYCRVTAIAAPGDWEQDLKNSQFSLSEIAKSKYEELLRRKLDDHLQKLERESLHTKIDRLLARCQPPAKWSPMNNYEFDSEIMKHLDDQRIEIVHGAALGRPLKAYPVSDDGLWYLQRTTMYFAGLVNLRYGLQIDTTYAGTLFGSKA